MSDYNTFLSFKTTQTIKNMIISSYFHEGQINMQRVYNLRYPEKAIQKGLVEMVDLFNGRFYSLFVDGQFITYTHEKSFETEVLKRSFIKQALKISGVTEEELHFVIVNVHDFMGNDDEYEGNFYMEDDGYENLLNIINKGGVTNMKDYQCHLFAVGVSDLESKV